MTDSDLSEISSTSDVNYSDIDFDTPNTTDMKFSDVSDYPCDESSVGNISFEKVKTFIYSNFVPRRVCQLYNIVVQWLYLYNVCFI